MTKNWPEATWLPVFFSAHEAIPACVPIESSAKCVADVHAVLGEGPVWVRRESALFWVDIKGLKIFRLDAVANLPNGRRRCAWDRWRRARAAGSSAAPRTASPRSIPRQGASTFSSTPRRTAPATASTTASSIGRAASGRARWTMGSGRIAAPSTGSTMTLAGMRWTAAIKSPMAQRSAPMARSCTTTIRRGS